MDIMGNVLILTGFELSWAIKGLKMTVGLAYLGYVTLGVEVSWGWSVYGLKCLGVNLSRGWNVSQPH